MNLKFTPIAIIKYCALSLIVFSSINFQLTAQEVILKEPQFPAPEKELLYFNQEDFVFDTNSYNGTISKIDRIYIEYNSSGQALGTNTEINQPTKKFISNKKIGKQPILDVLGVSSIEKIKRRQFRLMVFDSLDYISYNYTFKNGVIVNKSDEFNVMTSYLYDDKGRLIKKIIDHDYDGENIEIATYNSKGQIIEFKSFDTRDGLSVYEKHYTYNNLNLLIELKEEEAYYSIPWFEIEEETKKPIVITQLDYKKYLADDRQVFEKKIVFKYDINHQLIEANQSHNVYSKDGTAYYNPEDYYNFNYNISYGKNKLYIDASLPSKRFYEYTFDDYKNPINIKSYVVNNSGKWLHKETVLNITYK